MTSVRSRQKREANIRWEIKGLQTSRETVRRPYFIYTQNKPTLISRAVKKKTLISIYNGRRPRPFSMVPIHGLGSNVGLEAVSLVCLHLCAINCLKRSVWNFTLVQSDTTCYPWHWVDKPSLPSQTWSKNTKARKCLSYSTAVNAGGREGGGEQKFLAFSAFRFKNFLARRKKSQIET